jgi:hypothetical protein
MAAGIIDYAQQYTLEKAIEQRYKTIVQTGNEVTIVNPQLYRQRFMRRLTGEFFIGIK